MSNSISLKPLGMIIYLCLFLSQAGCANSNNNNMDLGGGLGLTSACPNFDQPCSTVKANDNNTIITCLLETSTCGVDLLSVLSQVPDVTADRVMWIQAWGARGGKGGGPTSFTSPGSGGAGGYAQTLTTVSDFATMNNGSTQIFYFLGEAGGNDGDHCGGQGGASTFVTLEDPTLNPFSNPTQSSPPFLLIAGGGGGGGGINGQFGCLPPDGADGAWGGEAFPTTSQNGEGSASQNAPCGAGGSGPDFGGKGGAGGSGEDCTSAFTPNWSNTEVNVSFSDGQGDRGGDGTDVCDSGGGGGGGGWGGGEGGNHGNDLDEACSGGGGGSFAIISTQKSVLAPTSKPGNPCANSNAGCVQIQFVLFINQ